MGFYTSKNLDFPSEDYGRFDLAEFNVKRDFHCKAKEISNICKKNTNMSVKKHFFDYIEEFPCILGTTNRKIKRPSLEAAKPTFLAAVTVGGRW